MIAAGPFWPRTLDHAERSIAAGYVQVCLVRVVNRRCLEAYTLVALMSAGSVMLQQVLLGTCKDTNNM